MCSPSRWCAHFSILRALAPDHLRGRIILFTQILAVLVVPLAHVERFLPEEQHSSSTLKASPAE